MDRYATHLEALTKMLLKSSGPILELGCGDYSTPVIAAFASAQGREFLVQASDESWGNRYRDIAKVQTVQWRGWVPPAPPNAERWGFVMLDSEENTAGRIEHLPKLLGKANIVLLHDANYAATRPRWSECVKGWDIEWFRRFDPHTAILTPC